MPNVKDNCTEVKKKCTEVLFLHSKFSKVQANHRLGKIDYLDICDSRIQISWYKCKILAAFNICKLFCSFHICQSFILVHYTRNILWCFWLMGDLTIVTWYMRGTCGWCMNLIFSRLRKRFYVNNLFSAWWDLLLKILTSE